jgi:aspartate/methionine/tyrosine aminotransferase
MRDFALEVYFSKWEFAAKYNLAGSDGENMTLAELVALASPEDRAAYDGVSLGYTETFGAPALRAEIAQTYDTVGPEHLLCFAGAEEAIYAAMQVLLNAGDHAVVITPNYQAAETVPLSICEVTGVPLDIERNWDLDPDLLRAAIRPNTKLISINFPNNPTGKIIPRAIFDAIVEICRSRGIWYKGAGGVEEFTRRLVEESGVLFLPSSVYRSELGPVPDDCLRVGFGRSHVPTGFAALRKWFELNHQNERNNS